MGVVVVAVVVYRSSGGGRGVEVARVLYVAFWGMDCRGRCIVGTSGVCRSGLL